MSCAFCHAENGPTAKFCSDCGSPLGLQLCPQCETVSEKAAAVCANCGYALVRAEESAVGGKLTPGPALPPLPADDHSSAKETQTADWHELLQSLEKEVHSQWDLQTRLAAEAAAEAPSQLAPAVSNPRPRRRIAYVHDAAVIEPTPPLWGSAGLWLALTCATGGCYMLLSLPSPEIEQRALISSVGKLASAPAVVSAAAIPSLQNETKPIVETPTSNSAQASAPSPPEAPPEEQTLRAEAAISSTVGNASVQSDQNEQLRAIPVATARLKSSNSQLPPAASGRLAFANRAAVQRPATSVSHLILTISPWGEVYVDNKKWGLSPPLTVVALKPGKHSVQIRNANLPPYDETIELQPDHALRIKHKFK
jgi:hypothetical protein